MSPRKAEKRAPYFNTSVDVDVDIPPWELERAGWVYVGGNNEVPTAGQVQRAVVPAIEEFHDDEHDGPLRWCRHIICATARGAAWADPESEW